MSTLSLLIFDLDGARFGVDATRVLESVWLPELAPVEEAPTWVAGVFSLRGRIVPVADLNLRFHHPAQPYQPSDQVVVLECDHQAMGVIVNEVREVIEISAAAVQAPPQFEAVGPAHLVIGEARVGDDLVTLLDASRLSHLPVASPHDFPATGHSEAPSPEPGADDESSGEHEPRLEPARHFCPEATPEMRALFRARATALSNATIDEDGARVGLAVVELGGECFGIELAAVQEFCDIVRLSPIPCCPPHILGAINLRGKLLTLIDPRAALNLPPAPHGGKAVVASLNGLPVGLAVDELHDVVYPRREELQPPPATLRQLSGSEITGTAPYAGRVITVLDLPSLLAREEWIVNEVV
jgi:purine-binding chemotaxis protein CheW